MTWPNGILIFCTNCLVMVLVMSHNENIGAWWHNFDSTGYHVYNIYIYIYIYIYKRVTTVLPSLTTIFKLWQLMHIFSLRTFSWHQHYVKNDIKVPLCSYHLRVSITIHRPMVWGSHYKDTTVVRPFSNYNRNLYIWYNDIVMLISG